MPDQPGEDVHRLRPDDELVVVRAVPARDEPRVRQLVVLRSSKPIEKVRTGAAPASAMSATTSARVDPAAQERPERDVGDEPAPDGVPEVFQQLRRRVGLRQRALGPVVEPPVPLEAHLAVFHQEVVRRRHPPDAGERRPGRRHVVVREVVGQRGQVRPRLEGGVGQEGFRLGGEDDPVAVEPVVQRLLARPVAREQEPAPAAVPEREREHAAEARQAVDAVRGVGRQQHLGVGLRAEPVPARFERRVRSSRKL